MKNLLFGIILLVTSNYSTAQNDTIYEENYRVLADMLFSNLDSSIYGPNLLNRSFSTNQLVRAQLSGDYNQIHATEHFLELYQDVSFSYLDSTKMMSNDSIVHFIENEFYLNELIEKDDEDKLVLPFGFLLHSSSYIDSIKANDNYFSRESNQIVPLVPQSDLFKTTMLKSASVIEFYPDNGYLSGTLKYTPGLVSTSSDISNLSISLDVGKGFQTFSEKQNLINYSRAIDSTIALAAFEYDKGRNHYFDTIVFYLNTDSNSEQYKEDEKRIFRKWDYKKTFTDPSDNAITYKYGILRGCGNSGEKLRRPLIMVPPYRPSVQPFSMRKYYKQFNFAGLIENLADQGYDVIFIKQKPGNLSLEQAGNFLAKFIDKVNETKHDDYPNENWENIIVGFSMGGQLARHALKKMEKEHMENNGNHHHTRLYIPFDSPHLGANIPMFTQAVYYDMKFTNIMANFAYNALTDEASKDMSVSHWYGSNVSSDNNYPGISTWTINPGQASERTDFTHGLNFSYNHQFTPLYDLRKSYPSFSRNISISTARNDRNYTSEYDLIPGKSLFHQTNVIGYSLGGLYSRTRRIHASYYSSSNPVFRNKEQYLFFNFIPITVKNREYRTTYATEWDMAQGGYKDEFLSGTGTGAISILKSGTFGIGTVEYDNHMSFLPLVSALGINPTIWSPNNLFYNVKEEGLMYLSNSYFLQGIQSETYGYPNIANPSNHFNVTPFEAVYCDPQTYEHIKMQASIDDNEGYLPVYLDYTRNFIQNEVEAEIVYLQNKVIGQNHRQDQANCKYRAWYKAKDKLIIGNNVTPKTDFGSYIIQSTGDIHVTACNEVVLSPGFETLNGGDFHAYVSCEDCSKSEGNKLLSIENEASSDYIENQIVVNEKLLSVINTEIELFPNPNNGKFTLKIASQFSKASYKLYNLLGDLLESGDLVAEKTLLNFNLEKGFFILHINLDEKQYIRKIQIL